MAVAAIAIAVLVPAILPALFAVTARAETRHVRGDLQQAVDAAAAGDTLLLNGDYAGPLSVDKPLSLVGGTAGRIIGNGQGSVITVTAPHVTVRGLTVTGSGLSLQAQDSGIFLDKTARHAVVSDNDILDNLIGVYVSGAQGALVNGNRITGRQDLRMNERGNGVQIWNAPGAAITHNRIRFGRDGIFATTSRDNLFQGNDMSDLRFAIHYMYTHKSRIIGNHSRGNHIGFAMMSSKDLVIEGNISEGDRDRGLLFNYANRITVRGNIVRGGTKKCLFIYNSNKNLFAGNLLSDCETGIHFTAGSERNIITNNAFVNNRSQVRYVGTRWLEWSRDGRGNYWSDHVAFDLDANGIADGVYRPNDLTDQIIWKYPSARLLINSPAVQVLKYAQSAFPALHPGGVTDSAPLMQIPAALASEVSK